MNRHVAYLIVIVGAVLLSGIIAAIRPLRADAPRQREDLLITPRMADTLRR